MIRTVLNTVLLSAAALALLSGIAAAQGPDFEREVWPVLKQACLDCHGTPSAGPGRRKKAKGGLRMDGKEWILKGGHEGPAIVAGSLKKSVIWSRVALPADDPDLMPPDGPRLKEEQLEILKKWIESGADFGEWNGVAAPTVKKQPNAPARAGSGAARLAMFEKLGEGVEPAASAAISKASGEDARIAPVLAGSPLLRVEFPGASARVDDKRLKLLAPITSNVTQLLLGNSAVTDKGLKGLARMKRLTHLDLHGTAVTSKAAKHLAQLKELRYLNLHSTEVDDVLLSTLIQLPRLEAVYLWNTEVTEEGAARLRLSLPKCRVSHRLVLPAPPARPAEPARRRRRQN